MLITCPIHGDFYQLPMSHIHGKGCSKCGDISMTQKQAYTTEEFINKSNRYMAINMIILKYII